MSDPSASSSSASSSGGGTSYVTVTFSPKSPITFNFEGLEGTEELGRPFLYDLDLSSGTAQGDLSALLGASVTVKFEVTKGDPRYFNGIVGRIIYHGIIGGSYRYRFELRPWIWLLAHTKDHKIFQNQTAWAIITSIFSNASFSDFSDKRQNQSGDQTLEYCVQYGETAFDFVTRLMEQWGIYYYFQHNDGSHTLVLADDPNSHTSIGKALPFQLKETEARMVQDHLWQWEAVQTLQSGAFTMRDYNFTTPSADLTAKSIQSSQHPYGSYEVYTYPGPYQTTGVGSKLAAIRMQDLTAQVQARSAMTNSRRVLMGYTLSMTGFPDSTENREYLVVRAKYHLGGAESRSSTDGELMDTFRCALDAIPSTVPFKLPRLTPKPLVHGPQTAKVTGASGDEITTDQYGRVHVLFPWDRVSKDDDTSSCWIRVAQIWAGVSWGAMFIPRVGQEVIVEFLDGDPDRPIITGRVYNANVTVPYTLPDDKTKSTIKSNSSQGGGGFNELRFEDKKGSEEVFFQAQKDYNKTVLNNETVTVTQDTTTTVKQGNRSITVSQGNNSLTVSTGTNTVTIKGNDSLTVQNGNHSITVSAGTSTIQAAQSITLQVGSNSIVINTSGITMSGTMISATAESSMSLDGGGSLTVSADAVSIN